MLISYSDQYHLKNILMISLAFISLYIIIAFSESVLIYHDYNAIPIWYPAGFAFAAVLIFGKRFLPTIIIASFLAEFIINLSNGLPIGTNIVHALLVSAGTFTQVFTGYRLFEYYKCNFNFLNSVRDTYNFVLVAVVIAIISSVINIIASLFIIQWNAITLLKLTVRFWLKDVAGILIITSFLISIFKNTKLNTSLARLFEIISIFTLSFIFIQIVFGEWIQIELNYSLPFIIVPLVLWIAFTLTPRETTITILIISVISILAIKDNFGLFAYKNTDVSILILQLYLCTIAIIVNILSVSAREREQVKLQLKEISESLEKRVAKRTDELATLNKELLVEVNQRKKAEAELKESQERNQALLLSLPDLIFLHDKDGRFLDYQVPDPGILFVNPHEFLGKEIDNVLPDSIAREFKKIFNKVIKTGITQNYEYSLNINNKENFFEARISICGEDRVMSVIRDISDRRKAEQERQQLEDQVRHAQKLESLGILAGGIAHDFNNLLTAIMGNTSLAMLGNDNPHTNKNLQNIEKASLRAADLCSQLLAYSGKGKFVVDAININDLVNEMSKLLFVSISKKVKIEFNFSKNIKYFEADPTQIRQIVMNLITNASEAIGEKNGIIQINTGTEFCDKNYLKNTFFDDNLKDGEYVFIEVVDNGSGMNKETINKIFDPFFTTKFTGRGLGLAAVIGIVRGHRGAIEIDSARGQGTKFKILFPVSTNSFEKAEFKEEIPVEWKGRGTVLVVDDDDFIRSLGKTTLEQAGLDVITATDGKDAVNIYKKRFNEINLVLMDMTMPNLNGEETFKKLQKINAGVKVILSSGYSEQEATKKFNNSSLQGFLQKPYRPADLIYKIKDLI